MQRIIAFSSTVWPSPAGAGGLVVSSKRTISSPNPYRHPARALTWIGLVVASSILAYTLNTVLLSGSEPRQMPSSLAPIEPGDRAGLEPVGFCPPNSGCWSARTGGYVIYSDAR
jgi:hypothetical protein